jgi:hypothetical protein
VLDYDRTISCIEVGQFDLSSSDTRQVVRRVFGGQGRLERLTDEVLKMSSLGVKVSVLSMNSSHTIRKSFKTCDPRLGEGMGKIWGFEDVPTNQIGLPERKSIW